MEQLFTKLSEAIFPDEPFQGLDQSMDAVNLTPYSTRTHRGRVVHIAIVGFSNSCRACRWPGSGLHLLLGKVTNVCELHRECGRTGKGYDRMAKFDHWVKMDKDDRIVDYCIRV